MDGEEGESKGEQRVRTACLLALGTGMPVSSAERAGQETSEALGRA